MIIAAGGDIETVFFSQSKIFVPQLGGKAGIEGLHPLQAEGEQVPEPRLQLLPYYELVAVTVGRMGKDRNASGVQNALNRLLGVQKQLPHAKPVDIVVNRLGNAAGIAVLHHQLRKMGLARVIHGEKQPHLFIGEGEAQLLLHIVQAHPELCHAQAVPLFDDGLNRSGAFVIAVAEDMVSPQFIAAGKLDPRQKERVLRLPQRAENPGCLDIIMVGNGKEPDPRPADFREQLFRAVGAVRNGRMHMQVEPDGPVIDLCFFYVNASLPRIHESSARTVRFLPPAFA